MSTQPSGWQTPRTNWVTTDPITNTDLNRAEGNTNAVELGSRTLDQALASPANIGTLRQILSWFAGRIRAITGAANWWDVPETTLSAANAHIVSASAHDATSAPTANRLILRDANGRAQVANGVAPQDIATVGQMAARAVYVQDNTEVTMSGTTETTLKSFRLVKNAAVGINTRDISFAAEVNVSAGTGTIRLYQGANLILSASTMSTAYVLVTAGVLDVSGWADGIYEMTVRLINSGANTTRNRFFEVYVR